MSRSRAIGTKAESAIVKVAREAGFPHADRQALHGSADIGDVTLCPGVVIEVKAGAQAHEPSDAQVQAWWEETVRERINARAEVGLLVLRRKGIAERDAGRWWCVVNLGTLIGGSLAEAAGHGETLVRLHLRDALALLRADGWGDPLPVTP